MTDEEQAEAVMAGLAKQTKCECGVWHDYAPYNKKYAKHPWEVHKVHCKGCDKKHGQTDIVCECGATIGYGPRAGWRIVNRKASNWKRVIQELRDRVAWLEQRAEEIG